ncbi:MAG TPA: tetratricopeptide repeat protein [Polyangiaceae bacterium]
MSRFANILIGSSALTLGVLLSTSALGETGDELKARAKAASEPPEVLSAARALRRGGLLVDAVNLLQRGFAKARGNDTVAELRLELARTYLDQRQPKKALWECDKLHKLAPRDEQICIAESALYTRRGSIALPAADAALALSPGNYDALIAKGRSFSQMGQTREAEAILRDAARAEPARSPAHRYLAELLLAQGKTTEGIAALREARRIDALDPEVLGLLGEALPIGAEARAALEQAISIRPSHAHARARLGVVLAAAGELDQAEKMLQEAITAEPRQAEWHAALGEVEVAKKKPDEALKSARAALKIVGNLGPAKLVEAKALAQKGDIDLAIEAFEAAYGFSKQDPSAPIAAARACLKGARLTTAKAFADRATEDFPKSGEAWDVLGDVAVALKDTPLAKSAYAKALAGDGLLDKDAAKRKLAQLK